MAILPIIKVGHPALRKKAVKVTRFDDALRQLAQNMIETMRLYEGIGLAGNQVNVLKRIFAIDLKLIDENLEPKVYINPQILDSQGFEKMEEGCLSIPGLQAEVGRFTHIRVRYQTVDGQPVEENLEGLQARVFQHELDHLEGILFIDRVPPLQRRLLEPKIKKIQEAYSLI